MRALVAAGLLLLAGCASNPPQPPVQVTISVSWMSVELLTDNTTPAGPISYEVDCWNGTGLHRIVHSGVGVTNQTRTVAPGLLSCQVRAVSETFGVSAPSEIAFMVAR